MQRLHLSAEDRKILGVCGGLARSLNLDANIIRLLFLISILFGGAGILVYFGLYVILPSDPGQTKIIDVEVENELENSEEKLHKIYRSRSDRMIGGVCGGLSDYLQWDVSIIRILFIALAISAGVGIWLYLFLWFVFPLAKE